VRGGTTLDGSTAGDVESARLGALAAPALLVLWSSHEPERVGEVLLPPPAAAPFVFGRGGAQDEDRYERLLLVRQRPGATRACPPLDNPFLSRRHLKIARHDAGLLVENVGRRPVLHDGEEVTRCVVAPGDTVEIQGKLLFACVSRPLAMPPLASFGEDLPAFGEPDAHGVVGESPLAWELRDRAAFFAQRGAHVLLTGESGAGKELVAQAIHERSARGGRALVARNAATLPASLIDAELFGNVANYPNVGMPERPGLIGEADGSTLFLDEIGELPADLQTHLLRVMDSRGEYQRLGEAKRRTANLRVIGATNRPIDSLKNDLAARLALRLHVPGLNERREDVPLLVRHLLRRVAAEDATIGATFFDGWDGRRGEPRIDVRLARALYLHRYTTHVRELGALLWQSLATSKHGRLELTDAVRRQLGAPSAATRSAPLTREPSRDEIRAALERNAWMQERAWRELGLGSRHVLARLLKKHGIARPA
jgi:two-component system nitrogen regulation response regulator GlnG/two-component system response regulator HydG